MYVIFLTSFILGDTFWLSSEELSKEVRPPELGDMGETACLEIPGSAFSLLLTHESYFVLNYLYTEALTSKKKISGNLSETVCEIAV